MDYAKHYSALIERARTRTLTGYVERHHVLPRCLGGGDEPKNIVKLSAEEHFTAHQLLVKINPDDARLVFAALAMTRGRKSNKRYGWLRRAFAQRIGEVWRGKTRAPFSDDHRRRIAEGQTGRVRGAHSDEHKAKLSAAHAGKTLTAEHRQRLSVAKLGIEREPYAQTTCPHCAKTGGGGTMKRWHFDNCKGINRG